MATTEIPTAALDIQAEQARQEGPHSELYATAVELLRRLDLLPAEVRPCDSLALRTEADRQAALALVVQVRDLPADERRDRPALLNAVGKLQFAANDFAAAERAFVEVAELLTEPAAKGEAYMNAYRAALERQGRDAALAHLIDAVKLDGRRFAPFPVGKYHPLKVLGAGGFGVAFLCKHKYLDAPVVVKAFASDSLNRPVEEVFAEAQSLRQVSHPTVVRVEDCGYADTANKTRPYMVMEHFDGLPLDEFVKKQGLLEPEEVVAVARQMAEGLKAAHDRGILHRDVKPANVLVKRHGTDWRVKLIDFGQAIRQPTAETLSTRQRQTLAGVTITGTLDYAAPEQLGKLSNVPASPASDIYGLGRTCCFALFQSPVPLPKHWKAIPEPLAQLLEGCLAEQPGERPADCGALLTGLSQVAPPPPTPATGPLGLIDSGLAAPSPIDEEVTEDEEVPEVPVYVAPVVSASRQPREREPVRQPGKRAARREWEEDDDEEERGGVPPWIWIAGAGALAVLLLGGVLVLFFLAGRKGDEMASNTLANSSTVSNSTPDSFSSTNTTLSPVKPLDSSPLASGGGQERPSLPGRTNRPGDASATNPTDAADFPEDETVTVKFFVYTSEVPFDLDRTANLLKQWADTSEPRTRVQKTSLGGEVKLTPVRDAAQFARRIDFASAVAQGRSISVNMNKDELVALRERFEGRSSATVSKPVNSSAPTQRQKPADEIEALLADLQDTGPFKPKDAAEKLKRMKLVKERQDAVSKALVETLTNSSHHFVRIAAAGALGTWGTKESIEDLERIVRKDSDVFVQRAAIDALGELHADSAAGAIAEAFLNFHLRQNATEALKKIGHPAEKAVQQILKSSDLFTRRDALILLRDIGTRDSISIIRRLLQVDRNHFIQQEGAATLAVLMKLPPKKP